MATDKTQSSIKLDALKWLSHIQIHGANRLASREASWFWIPSMILLLICASTLLHLILIRYLSNPTFMLEVDMGQSVLVFPSIIIYPGVDFRTYKKNKFLAEIKYPTNLNETYIRHALPQLAAFFSSDVPFKVQDLLNLEYLLAYNNIDVETAGRRLTENCEETLIRCRWNDQVMTNCSHLFRLELGGAGFCCVFNGRSLRREMQENAHLHKKIPVYYTNRVGFRSGLMVAINQTQKHLNIDLSYKWIALQAGRRFVDPILNGTALNPRTEQWVAYYVQNTYITDTAKRLGKFLRRCVMSDDDLHYFPGYKRKYCVLECEMARTIKRCGCVRLTHPRPPGVAYCTAQNLMCALRVTADPGSCQCPPTCDVNTALTRMSSFSLDPTMPTIDKFYKGLDYDKVTIVRAFVQKRYRSSKQRGSYYSYVDLFAQLGGMFNLFFGCSILTLLGVLQLFWRITPALWDKLRRRLPKNGTISRGGLFEYTT